MCDRTWYEKFLDLNPRTKLRRDLTVAYGESKGGLTLEYLKRLMPRYWLDNEVLIPGQAGKSLGLSPEEENAILADLGAAVVKGMESSSLRTAPADLVSWKMP